MERAGGDEQYVVRFHHAVAGRHRRAFHQRQQVALHAFPGHVRAAYFGAARHLVDLIQEYQAVLFHVLQCPDLDLILVHHFCSFFLCQDFERLPDPHFSGALFFTAHALEQPLQLAGHLFHTRRRHDLHTDGRHADFYLDFLVIQFTAVQQCAEPLPGSAGLFFLRTHPGRRQKNIQHPVFRGPFGPVPHFFHLFFTGHLDGDVCQVPHNGFHVPAYITHFGKLGRLNLDERRVRQFGQAPGDLRLSHSRRAYHQDILGRDLVSQFLVDLGAPPAVAQCNRHSPLCRVLADDMLIQFRDDLFRRQCFHYFLAPSEGSSSRVMLRFV